MLISNFEKVIFNIIAPIFQATIFVATKIKLPFSSKHQIITKFLN